MFQTQSKIDELQKQVENRKMVYENLVRDKKLEVEHSERIRKQFQQKQWDLEYVFLLPSPFFFIRSKKCFYYFVRTKRNELHKCELKLFELQLKAANGNNDARLDEGA